MVAPAQEDQPLGAPLARVDVQKGRIRGPGGSGRLAAWPTTGGSPRAVYAVGAEPDPRFSLANERTFLAWIRTALALIAAGVGVDAVAVPLPAAVRAIATGVLLVLGLALPVLAWVGWARAERAMRLGRPLPASIVTLPLAIGLLAVAAAVVLGGAGAVTATRGPGLQGERTELSWRRSLLALAAGSLLAMRLLAPALGPWAVVLGSAGIVVTAALWIVARRRSRVAAAVLAGREPPSAMPDGAALAALALLTAAGAVLAWFMR